MKSGGRLQPRPPTRKARPRPGRGSRAARISDSGREKPLALYRAATVMGAVNGWMGGRYMEIYVLRHGIAADARPGEPDANRALTEEGREKLNDVLARARAVGVEPDVVLASPLRRAVETARIAAVALNYAGEVLQTRALLPGSAPEEVWEEIRRHRAERFLLAGHEPLLSRFLSWMLNCPYVSIELKKGALARVDVVPTPAQPRGVLHWLITAKLAGGR